NFLNPRAYFFLSGQFFHQRLLDFPSESITDKLTSASGGPLEEDNYMTSRLVNTSYFHNKIAPMFFWLRDITNNANMFKAQVTYDRSDKWDYTLGALMLDGQRAGLGLEPLKHKDQVFFTVRYRFQ
ncbi:MAG: hypothetical protein HY900_31445, partial [Deltaproteobacteria bacterium]|nr:hypothetical protein [Deltaproteobacteria bacterium]